MTLEEYRNQQHEIDLVLFSWDFQNAERPRCPRQPIRAMDGARRRPRHDENHCITFH